MKNQYFLAALAAFALLVPRAGMAAQEPASPPVTAPPAAPAEAAVQLSPAVQDVLKLSRAKISEEVTLSFIRNSGARYSLTAAEIVYLRNEGGSDRVIAAMLNQPSGQGTSTPTSTPTATPATQPAAPAASPSPAVNAAVAPVFHPVATVYQTPVYAPAQTVYVVSDPVPSYSYYPAYPYCGWVYPAFSIGIGGRWGHGHGGYYHGGGRHR